MIVYGKRRKKYVLAQTPVSQDYDGAVYAVPDNPDILVKIYQPEYRSAETEKLVIDTANGKCSMLDESPVDVVYAQGRFAGYIFEKSVEVALEPEEPVPVAKPTLSNGMGLLICIVAGLALSALIYYVLFDVLRNLIGDPYCYWNFSGVPMIIGGWILMILAFLRFQDQGTVSVVISIAGFLLGAAVLFGVISLIVVIVNVAWSIAKALLPAVAVIAAIVMVVKLVIKK